MQDRQKLLVTRLLPLCRFASEEGKHSLQRVLHAYAAFDEEVNYCQVRDGVKQPHMLR